MAMNNLDLGDPAVFDALKDVQDDSTETTWCVFGYVPKTPRLKVIETGKGTVADMAYEMSNSKLHFGYLRYEMSETWKFVVVAWCGEAVPANLKGFFAGHTQEFEAYLRKNGFNYAASISAREESDLDEAEIVKALNKTSTFIRARTTREQQQPTTSLKQVRTQFWNKQDEVDQTHEAAVKSHRQQREKEDLDSRAATEQRIRREADEMLRQREQEREDEVATFKREQQQIDEAQKSRFEEQRTRIMGQSAQQRDANRVESDASASRGPQQRQAPGRGNVAQRFQEQAAAQQAERDAASVSRAAPPAQRPAMRKPEPEPEYPAEEEQYPAEEEQQYPAEEEQQYPAEEEQYPAEEEQYPAEEEQQYPAEEEQYPAEEEQYPAEEEQQYPAEEEQYPAEEGAGAQQAKALYDYEAAQEGDLGFSEGDLITLLDTSDPSGWWQGELNGVTGTFPSNFVEIV